MKKAWLLLSLAASPICAQEAASTANSSAITSMPVVAVAQASSAETSVLDLYGIVSTQHLITALDANLTPAQRAQVEQAVAARNASLVQANNQLKATLQEVMGETSEGFNSRLMAPAEARRMEAMRRAQPARYLHLMSKRRQKLKNRQ